MFARLRRLTTLALAVVCFGLLFFQPVDPAIAAENSFINTIQKRGVLKVGLPPYQTPPAYYVDSESNTLKGYDVELAQGLAEKLGVGIEFDRTSKSFNSLVKRVGADDFDIAIGKLGLTYNRLFDAFPIQYLSFRHALLANRKFIASLDADPEDPNFGKILMQSKIRIGSIANSTWETEAKINFPNAQFVGFRNWKEAQDGLFGSASQKPVVDAIYRDATEIKPIVYKKPSLSLDYVPILFDDLIDRKSIYLSEKGFIGLSDFLNVYIKREWGEVKTDQNILDEYESFHKPVS